MKKAAIAGLAALTLLDISAATPVAAQGAKNPFAGAYVGAHAGYFDGEATFNSAPYTFITGGDSFAFAGRKDTFSIDGFLAGVHGGFNFVTPGNILFGIEGDWTYLGEDDSVSASGSGVSTGSDGFTFQRRSEIEFEWQSTVRGRLGFVSGNTLFFATAGVAFLDVDWSETDTLVVPATSTTITVSHSASDTLVGAVVGGGFEVAITPTVFFGADYLYEDFESFNSVPHGFLAGATGKIDDINIHKVRVRISIKLGGGTP